MTSAAILRVVTPTAGKPEYPGAIPHAKENKTSLQLHNPVANTRRKVCRKALTLQTIGKFLLIYALIGEFAIGTVSVWASEFIGTVGAVVLCIVSLAFGLTNVLLASYLFGTAATLYAEAQKLRRGGR